MSDLVQNVLDLLSESREILLSIEKNGYDRELMFVVLKNIEKIWFLMEDKVIVRNEYPNHKSAAEFLQEKDEELKKNLQEHQERVKRTLNEKE